MKLFQSFLNGDQQRRYVSPAAIPFDASQNTAPGEREYALMKQIHAAQGQDPEPWGLISWRFSHKCQVSPEAFIAFAQAALDSGKECAFINPMIGSESIYLNVWQQGAQWSPKLRAIAEFLRDTEGLDLNVMMGRQHFAFCNYFVAKPAFWRDWFEYVDRMLARLESEARSRTNIGSCYTEPAGYVRDAGVTMKPFVVERLFSSFLMTRPPESVSAFEYEPRIYVEKFGRRLGQVLLNFSQFKQRLIETQDLSRLREWKALRQSIGPELLGAVPQLDDPSSLMENPACDARSLDALHRNRTGKVSDKWSSYLGYYDSLLAPIADAPLRLLEIGVQNGGSLETWAGYFLNAERIIGCDIDPKCASLRYDDPRIQVVVGDANARDTYRRITELSPQFDLIIDDGSHLSRDILRSFVLYFPRLSPGGLYVVEDAHCLFMNDYGGGVLNDSGAQAFFKRLTDVVNFEFWREQTSVEQYLCSFFDTRATPGFILEGWIESVEFRNSVITIRKALRPGHEKLGERITAGTDAAVMNLEGVKRG